MFKTKKFWLFVIIIFVLLSASLATFYKPFTQLGKKVLFRQPTYYAVHLNNNQVYYGQIKSIKPETIVLADVYYLESYEAQPEPSAGETFQIQPSPQTIYNFVKRGSVDPLLTNNVLFINRSAVLFWEKLKPGSQIVKLIEKAQFQK